MKKVHIPVGVIVAMLIAASGSLLVAQIVFADRMAFGTQIGTFSFLGTNHADVNNTLRALEQDLLNQSATIAVRDKEVTRTFHELGAHLDHRTTWQALRKHNTLKFFNNKASLKPALVIDEEKLASQLSRDFEDVLQSPVNASIINNSSKLQVTEGRPGEVIDYSVIMQGIVSNPVQQGNIPTITPPVIATAPRLTTSAILGTKSFADKVLTEGLSLTYGDEVHTIWPKTISDLLIFEERVTPRTSQRILTAQLSPLRLREHLEQYIAPEINQEAKNARFELGQGKVTQFSLPAPGLELDVPRTANHINVQFANHQSVVPLAVNVTNPEVTDTSKIEELGLTNLLAVGESDYVGSPKNRKHNIAVGADRYHGLLIPPQAEFSFNEFLGPVTGEAGFKPELVIKSNVTTPEYGGGLCQVSTTIFRAALNAGLEVTNRRNHSYAVRYYGTPGLDATIYPPYTDLQFLNNTPGYILIQRRIEGTKLTFEFWGTSDGREVEVTDPYVYDRQPNGAVKATVSQKVTRNGEVLVEDKFYSRYKSPNLFPKTVAANGG